MPRGTEIGPVPAPRIERLVRSREIRRLVHVVPKPGHAQALQPRLLAAPPPPDPGVEEIRKPRPSWPGLADEILLPVACLDERVQRATTAQHSKARLILDTRVHDRHHAKAPAGQPAQHRRRPRELATEGEHAVAVEVMDVEIERVTGQPPAAEFAGGLLEAPA